MVIKNQKQDIKHIMEDIETAIESNIFTVKWNLKSFIRGLLWQVVAEHDRDVYFAGKLDNVIDHIFKTSHQAGPTDESHPAWDEKNKDINKDIEVLSKILQEYGIQQSWNYRFKPKKGE